MNICNFKTCMCHPNATSGFFLPIYFLLNWFLIMNFFFYYSLVDSALSTARIEELIQEDQNVKHRRERIQRQSSLLSKLTRQLSIHDNRAAAASSWSNGGGGAGKYNCICCRLPFLLCFGYLNWTDNNACRIKNFPCL